MKKRRNALATILPFLLSLVICLGAFPIFAESADSAPDSDPPVTAPEDLPITAPESEDAPIPPSNSVLLTPPEAIRAGETVEFIFHCDGEEIRAIQGSLTYDPALLTYVSSDAVPADWKITFSEEGGQLKYLGLSTENRGIMGKTALFSVTFRVNAEAATDTALPFTLSDATAYDGSGELTLAGGDCSFTVARPLSTECTLTALSVKGGNLSPAFSPEITAYTVKLPYSAHLAEISATPCQYGKLKYSSRDLAVGENEITVTVISETGLQQVYTITVIRAADPNYIPSTDNRILSLELSDGLLFPAFSPEITEYTIYMVQEYDVTLTPTAADKAVADGLQISAIPAPDSTEDNPTAGTYTVVCYAEDGTPRTYIFKTILLSTPEQLEEVRRQNAEPNDLVLWVVVTVAFVCVVIFFLGFVMGNVLRSKKKSASTAAAIAAASNEDAETPADSAESAPDKEEQSKLAAQSGKKSKKGKKKKH